MPRLDELPGVAENIRRAPRTVAKALDYFISLEIRRLNRRHLNEFAGFDFKEGDENYEEHVKEIVETMQVSDLIAICLLLGLSYAGTIEELTQRITTFLISFNNKEQIIKDEEQQENDEDEGSEEDLQSQTSEQETTLYKPRFTMNFRDVEDSIKAFDGEDAYPVQSWITDFEDLANVMGFNELQKLVFAKKSLKGLAKLYVQGEKKLNSWEALKQSLKSEFGKKISSADLHLNLSKRKMQRGESVLEYMLKMKELASRGDIEQEAVIQYIVDGIPDDPSKKITLYESRNFRELKDKLEVYMRITKKQLNNYSVKNSNVSQQQTQVKNQTKYETRSDSNIRCYNCGGRGHVSSKCLKPKRTPGSCYSCGSTDHQKTNCPKTKREETTTSSSHTVTHLVETVIVPEYLVKIRLDNNEADAIVDTGSPISLLCETFVPKNCNIEPHTESLKFQGVNGSKLEILGRLSQTVTICSDINIVIHFYVVSKKKNYEAFMLIGP